MRACHKCHVCLQKSLLSDAPCPATYFPSHAHTSPSDGSGIWSVLSCCNVCTCSSSSWPPELLPLKKQQRLLPKSSPIGEQRVAQGVSCRLLCYVSGMSCVRLSNPNLTGRPAHSNILPPSIESFERRLLAVENGVQKELTEIKELLQKR